MVSLYVSAGRERELDRTNCPGGPGARRMAEMAAAEKLAGDLQDLIRAMPAEGDRPRRPILAGRQQVEWNSPATGTASARSL